MMNPHKRVYTVLLLVVILSMVLEMVPTQGLSWALGEEAATGARPVDARAVDISFWHNGQEVEPANGLS